MTDRQTIESMLLYLAKYPHIQQAIYNEIKQYSFIAHPNNPMKRHEQYLEFDLTKIIHCHYFRAFISESMRLSLFLPKSIPKSLTCDCSLKFNVNEDGDCCDIMLERLAGTINTPTNDMVTNINTNKHDFEYVLSKDFIIEGNFLLTNLTDRKIWDTGSQPMIFDINRWLKFQHDIKKYFDITASTKSYPFGCGPRDCVAKSFAKKCAYGVVANLLVNYKFRSIDGTSGDQFKIEYKNGYVRDIDPKIGLKVFRRNNP